MTVQTRNGGALTPGGRWRNWSRAESAHPAFRAAPASVEEVVGTVRTARERGLPLKVVGAGHSFTAIAATDGVLLDLGGLSGLLGVDAATGRARFAAGTTLARASALLAPHGLALQNLGDIDRQTLAGATSTGTHGTGARFGGLATQLTAVTLVTADGALLRIAEDENAELLPAARIGLGALGVVVELEVQCVPAFLLRAVERPESWDAVLGDFAARAESVDHFEFYWWPHTDRVMTKTNHRLPAGAPRDPVGPIANWVEERVTGNGLLAAACGLGHLAPALTPGLNRLATRLYGDREYTDGSHEVFTAPRTVRFRELEYALPRELVPAALRELRALVERSGWRVSFPVEVRVAAADDTWLSTAFGRDSGYIAVHRYWRDDHLPLLRAADALFRGFGGRPHWGKIHFQDAAALAASYPRFDDFRAVRDRLDPERAFANDYLRRVLGD